MHPYQFHVNEAWIAFKLNDAPISAGLDGDFNFIAIMDAASCFIMGGTPVPASAAEPSKMEAGNLLKEGQAHRQQLPGTLFIPNELPATILSAEAKRRGITVVRVPEAQLLPFIGEARDSFKERLSGS